GKRTPESSARRPGLNWRSFTGIERKRNAGTGPTATGVPHRGITAVRNARTSADARRRHGRARRPWEVVARTGADGDRPGPVAGGEDPGADDRPRVRLHDPAVRAGAGVR